MIKEFLSRFGIGSKPVQSEPIPPKRERPRQVFSTQEFSLAAMEEQIEKVWEHTFANSVHPQMKAGMDSKTYQGFAMDAQSVKSSFYGNEIVPVQLMLWF